MFWGKIMGRMHMYTLLNLMLVFNFNWMVGKCLLDSMVQFYFHGRNARTPKIFTLFGKSKIGRREKLLDLKRSSVKGTCEQLNILTRMSMVNYELDSQITIGNMSRLGMTAFTLKMMNTKSIWLMFTATSWSQKILRWSFVSLRSERFVRLTRLAFSESDS